MQAEQRISAFQHFSTSARSTGGFERLPGTRPAICRSSRRPKGRSSPRNDLESGECRLTLLGCDSVIIVWTTTSGWVRATVVDAFSLNYRVILAEEGCFDRSEASHAVTPNTPTSSQRPKSSPASVSYQPTYSTFRQAKAAPRGRSSKRPNRISPIRLLCCGRSLWLRIEFAQSRQDFLCKERDVRDGVVVVQEAALAEH